MFWIICQSIAYTGNTMFLEKARLEVSQVHDIIQELTLRLADMRQPLLIALLVTAETSNKKGSPVWTLADEGIIERHICWKIFTD